MLCDNDWKSARVFAGCLLALVVVFAGGCTTYSDYEMFVTHPKPVVSSQEYRMAPPDIVLLSSKRVREINNHSEMIRPDGKITLPLLGAVMIAGMTPEQASAEIQEKARQFYDDADVSLRVAGFNSQKIYVFGEVSAPGPYPYDGANTVLETLAQAQPTRLADPARIQVLRPGPDGKPKQRMTVDLNQMVKAGDTTQDAVLEDGDIVYVPANGLAAVGLALQQLLLPIQPAASVVRGPADIESTVVGTNYGRE